MPADNYQDSYQDSAISLPNPESTEQKPGLSLYQTATLLAMLLFLLSFWSC